MADLTVGITLADPPFTGVADGSGLDVDLIEAIGGRLGSRVVLVTYEGPDFDGIFAGLADGSYDCVIAGTTVTPDRMARASFAPPYLVSGQALAVDAARLPAVRSIDDLAGLTIGVQRGHSGQSFAEGLVVQGRAGAVRVYDDVGSALGDLTVGGCDAVMKLGPVLAELVAGMPDVEVVQRGLTREDIAIAVAPDDGVLLKRIALAQAELEADGTLQGLRRKWLGNPYRDQTLAAH